MDWFAIVKASIELIENSIERKPDADSVSRVLCVSSFYYQKMFATICGVTVGEYIRNRRLTRAGEELSSGDARIIDIALKYGYETHESFTRAFTRFHGVTPSKARLEPSRLKVCPRLTAKDLLGKGESAMESIGERGYIVKETGAVYFTEDMDATLDWFTKTLGWYGQIDSRDSEGKGAYGCVNHIPMEIEALHIAPFTGIHMFKGAPTERLCGFMLVDNVTRLRERVTKSGWQKVTPLKEQPWGAKECTVTTIDGSLLIFFEL